MSVIDQNTSNSSSARPTFSCSSLKTPEGISDLIHKFGHDIGNPLTAVISMSSVLSKVVEGGLDLENKFVQKIPTYTESISKEAWRIGLLNERLVLLFSNRTQLSQPSDIEVEFSKSLNKLRQHGVCTEELLIDSSFSDQKLTVHVDPAQFIALTSEVLRNAIYATLEYNQVSGKSEAVSFDVKNLGDSVQIKISNPIHCSQSSDLSSLFNPFESGDQSKKDSSGLGLTVAWAVVERFGGQIEVTQNMATPEDGEFTVTIELPSGDYDNASAKQLTPKAELPGELKILILEDEEVVASAIEKILNACLGKQSKLEIEIFSDSKVLGSIKPETSYDAILCDVKLADINASFVVDRIKQNNPQLLKKLAFMSGNTVSPEVELLVKNSGCQTLQKPFETESLISLVKQLVFA